MNEEKVIQLRQTIDEEISLYKDIESLYVQKKEALIGSKLDLLENADRRLLENSEKLNEIKNLRIEKAKFLGVEIPSISKIIEKLYEKGESKHIEDFRNQEKELKNLVKSITLLERTNKELLQHGIIIVNKTVQLILNAVMPERKSNYNNKGKIQDTEMERVSSVIKKG